MSIHNRKFSVSMTYDEWMRVLRALAVVGGRTNWIRLSPGKDCSPAECAASLGSIDAEALEKGVRERLADKRAILKHWSAESRRTGIGQ